MVSIFKLGLGGKIGNGKQAMSWIHIEDLVNAHNFLIEKQLDGIFNYTAPIPTTNEELTKVLAKTLHRPAIFPVPVFMLKLILSEGATILVDGQKVIPQKLMKEGFEFKFKTIEEAVLASVL